mgnify:CR=1 FL=1
MEVGRMIFFDKLTGEVIVDTGEREGNSVRRLNPEEYVPIYIELSSRNPDSYDYIELNYRDFAQDFIECISYRVNTENKELEFKYPDGNGGDTDFQPPLTTRIEKLEEYLEEHEAALIELAEIVLRGGNE